MMGKIKVWVGPVVHISILFFYLCTSGPSHNYCFYLTKVKKNTSINTLQIIYILCRSSCGMFLVQYV